MYKIIISSLFLLYFCGVTPSGIVGLTGVSGFKDVSEGSGSVTTRSIAKPTQATAQAASSSSDIIEGERHLDISYNDGQFKGTFLESGVRLQASKDLFFISILDTGTLEDLKYFIDLAKKNKIKLNYVNLLQDRPQHLVGDDLSAISEAILSIFNPVEKVNYLWKFYSQEDLQKISNYGRFGKMLQDFLIQLSEKPNEELAEHLIELIKLTNRSMTDIDSTRGNTSFRFHVGSSIYILSEDKILKQIVDFAKQDTPLSQKVIRAILEKEPSIKDELLKIDPALKLPEQKTAQAASSSQDSNKDLDALASDRAQVTDIDDINYRYVRLNEPFDILKHSKWHQLKVRSDARKNARGIVKGTQLEGYVEDHIKPYNNIFDRVYDRLFAR